MISLGIDIGGTGCKCVAFRDDGTQLAIAYTEYPLAAGQVNLPPDILTSSVFQVIARCTAQLEDKQDIAAITVSSFGESFAAVDEAGNALTDILPRSMIPVILQRAQIPASLQANALTKQQRRQLLTLMKAYPVEIAGKRPVSEAIITSGGIKVSEVDPKTMMSKLVPGLYFAGEILDCDAYTGGFNLQIAFSTGYAAGASIK